MTQHEKILNFLYKNGSITPMEAFRCLGITKLSTRIGEIEIVKGIKINHVMVTDKKPNGETKRYMCYTLGGNNG